MYDFVDASVDAAEIADAIAEVAKLDRQPFSRIDLEEPIEDSGVRAVDAYLDEIVGVGEVLDRHERRRLERALEFRADRFRLRSPKRLPAGMRRELVAPLGPFRDIGMAPHLDRTLLRADFDEIAASALADDGALDRPALPRVSREIIVEAMRDQGRGLERRSCDSPVIAPVASGP